jgi:phosphate starvation-inducible protein PhoH and related proteins
VTPSTDEKKADTESLVIDFDDPTFLPDLFGDHDRHLARIEQILDVSVSSRGSRVVVAGDVLSQRTAEAALRDLYRRLEAGLDVAEGEVDAAVRMARTAGSLTANGNSDAKRARSVSDPKYRIKTYRRVITPRTPTQADYIDQMRKNSMVFGLGPAGTGKTYLAVVVAVSMLAEGLIDRIILSRPAVEAGERLGFLPGDMREKVDPYLRPLYDALHDMMPSEQVEKRLDNGEIEVAPIAFMRGRTLSSSFVILDEAQNTTSVQMKMFLTRLGDNSRMVITGDPSQIDLPKGIRSGLVDALEILEPVKGIGVTRFSDADIVRHSLVTRIVQAYDRRDRDQRPKG